jgi:hypothetical protein
VIVVGDTSGLVAAFNIGNPEHQAARAALREAQFVGTDQDEGRSPVAGHEDALMLPLDPVGQADR